MIRNKTDSGYVCGIDELINIIPLTYNVFSNKIFFEEWIIFILVVLHIYIIYFLM